MGKQKYCKEGHCNADAGFPRSRESSYGWLTGADPQAPSSVTLVFGPIDKWHFVLSSTWCWTKLTMKDFGKVLFTSFWGAYKEKRVKELGTLWHSSVSRLMTRVDGQIQEHNQDTPEVCWISTVHQTHQSPPCPSMWQPLHDCLVKKLWILQKKHQKNWWSTQKRDSLHQEQ